MILLECHESPANPDLSIHVFEVHSFHFKLICQKWLYPKLTYSPDELFKLGDYLNVIEDSGSNTQPGCLNVNTYLAF
jgi:hypothetical protein